MLRRKRMKIAITLFFIGINFLIPLKSLTCPIPVFRYALEFWEAEPYRLEIFYRNSPGSLEEDLINYLVTVTGENEMKSNFIMRMVNVEGDDHDIPESMLKAVPSDGGALMVLRYPFMSGINSVLWSAPLSVENVGLLLNSPVRENIANRLITDATAIWIFLESGDARKDREALALLERELRRLEQTLVLPDYDLWLGDYSSVSGGAVPEIKFDVVRVSRNDYQEELLVRMLMNTEHYLENFKSEPIIFPIYGRGIALWAIIGDRINEINITRAAEFLTGPCSCQVKSLNPGIDLLISMDWDNLVENIADISLANPLSGMGDFSSRESETRRQLESATHERLISTGKTDPDRETGQSGNLQRDILRDSMQKGKLEGPVTSYEISGQKTGIINIIIMVLAGITGVILLLGLILYRKNIK